MTEPAAPDDPAQSGSRLKSILIQIAGLLAVGGVLWYLFTQVVDWNEVVDAVRGSWQGPGFSS